MKFAPFVTNGWSNLNNQYLPQLQGMDFLIMAPSADMTIFVAQGREFLDNTLLPVVIDIQTNYAGSCAEQTAMIDKSLAGHGKIVGYALYDYANYTANGDFASCWVGWHK